MSRLRKEGHEVLYLDEYEAGIEDVEVLRAAVEHDAIVITNDKDFGELISRHGFESRGVIFLRLYDLSLSERIEIVIHAMRIYGSEFKESFTVISEDKVRIRKCL